MPTRTDPLARTETTRVHLTRSPGGTVRLRGGGGAFRVMLLERGPDGARIALVPERALLIAGDDVAVEVEVDPGLRLEVTETGGTVAYDMRGGSARWAIAYRLGAGASLHHEALPWVSAQGSDVVRTTTLDLATEATASLAETLVLGRFGEAPGRLVAHTCVRRDRAEVLVEELHTDDLTADGLGGRVLETWTYLGTPAPRAQQGWSRLDLASGDVSLRRLER